MAEKKEITKRLNTICDYICQNCYGQGSVIKLALLCAIAKEKIFISYKENEELMIRSLLYTRLRNAFKIVSENSENVKTYINKIFVTDKNLGTIITAQGSLSDTDYLDYLTKVSFPEISPSKETLAVLFTLDEIDSLQKEIDIIPLSDCVKQLIISVRSHYNIEKLKRLIHIARTSAFLNGRNEVVLVDFCNLNIIKLPFNSVEVKKYINQPTKINCFEKNDSLYSEILSFENLIQRNGNYPKECTAVEAQKKCLKTKYTEIMDCSSERISILESWKKEFNENNFFELGIECHLWLERIDSMISDLPEVEEYIKEKYEKIEFSFVSDINIGDYICSNGKTGSFAKDYRKEIVPFYGDEPFAIICLKGEKADSIFGINCEQCQEIDYSEAEKIVAEYKLKNCEVYSSGWILPTIEQCEEIYNNLNMATSNYGLEKLKDTLKNRYWSSTKKDDNSVYYFDFSTGKKDYTTPDHKYNVALLHRFYCGKE